MHEPFIFHAQKAELSNVCNVPMSSYTLLPYISTQLVLL
jgi:hypothetical protein